jgi:hypothetical protein
VARRHKFGAAERTRTVRIEPSSSKLGKHRTELVKQSEELKREGREKRRAGLWRSTLLFFLTRRRKE